MDNSHDDITNRHYLYSSGGDGREIEEMGIYLGRSFICLAITDVECKGPLRLLR